MELIATEDEEETSEPKWKLVLPHIALVTVLSGYILLGAFVMFLIESPEERRIVRWHQEQMTIVRKDFLRILYEEQQRLLAQGYTKSQIGRLLTLNNFMGITNRTNTAMDEYNRQVTKLWSNTYYTNAFRYENDYLPIKYHWSGPSSLLWSVTTLTTVGYGTPAPSTDAGRIFCIVYGLLGVPLMIVTLADLAKFLGTFLQEQYTYWRRRYAMSHRKGYNRREIREMVFQLPISSVFGLLMLYPIISAVLIMNWEETLSEYANSFYFCFISVFTIGFGDFVPENEEFYTLTILFILLGLIITTMCVDLVAVQYVNKIHYFGRALGAARERMLALMRKGLRNAQRAQAYHAAYRPRLRIEFVDDADGKAGAMHTDIFESSSELSDKDDVLMLM